MARLPFSPPPGIFPGDTSFSRQGRWLDCDKVRFEGGQAEVIGGWERLMTEKLSGVCRGLFPWSDNLGELNLAFGTHSALQVWTGGSLYTITPAGMVAGLVDGTGGLGFGTGAWDVGAYGAPSTGDYFPRTWSFSAYGPSLIANPRGGSIYRWNNTLASPAAVVANAPVRVTSAGISPERQLLAFGCNEEVGGAFNPLAIRGSDIENLTSWASTPSNNAFEHILEGGGRIVSHRWVGSVVFVWTDFGLYQGTFLGDPGQTYRFEPVGRSCGLIGPNGVVVVGQSAFWMDPARKFWTCVPGGAPEPIPCPIDLDLAPVQHDKVYASAVTEFGEVRWDYPHAADGVENSRYVALNLREEGGPWCRGSMARTAGHDLGPAVSPVMTDPAGAVFYHERGHSADGGAVDWWIESADQTLGEQVALIKGLWPDFHAQQGPVLLSLLTRQFPQGTERVKGPFPLDVGRGRRDFRVSARLVRLRFAGASAPTFCRIGRPDFEIEGTGFR